MRLTQRFPADPIAQRNTLQETQGGSSSRMLQPNRNEAKVVPEYRRTIRLLESVKPDRFLSFHAEVFDLEGKRGRMGAEGVRAWMERNESEVAVNSSRLRTPLWGTFLLLAACGATETQPQSPTSNLGGTSWQLVKFQGGDDKTLLPDDKAKYTIIFGTDGAVSARIDCNRGSRHVEVVRVKSAPTKSARAHPRHVPPPFCTIGSSRTGASFAPT